MKKKLLLVFFIIAALIVKGQNYDLITLYYTTAKFEDAKKELDKLMANPAAMNKAETFLWNLNVYSELLANKILNPKYPDALSQAVDGLEKYASKEPSLKLMKETGLRSISLLYSETFIAGRDYFQKTDWANSFNSFSTCQQVSEFIGKNALTTNGKYTIDTAVVLYTGYAAQNAGKISEANARYKALADWRIGGSDYEDIYKYILDYDTKQKDEASFNKYLAFAKQLYPSDAAVWNLFASNYKFATLSLTDLINNYRSEDAKGKMSEDDYLNYAESFATIDKDKLKNAEAEQKNNLKLLEANAFTKAFAKNNNGLYAYNAGILYYNIFSELDNNYYNLKGESDDIRSKKNMIQKQQDEVAIKSIEWLEKAYTILKIKTGRDKNENSSLNRCVDFLANLYMWKRDLSKNVNQADYNSFDTKYKFYDGEHNKYK